MKYAKTIDPDFVKHYRYTPVPWGPVGYVTYKRTYARMTDEGRTEEWWETVRRSCNGLLAINGAFTQDEIQKLYHYVFSLKCNFSGRALWQLGTKTVEKLGGDSLQNCWQVNVDNPVDPFTFTFNELMLGGGVGFNITPESVYELPIVKYNISVERVDDYDCDLIVTDNREGWVKLLELILQSFFYTGKSIRYNTRAIRARGMKINSFGGIASGSEELVIGMGEIVNVLRAAYGRKLKPVECLDIMNIIGKIVVSGNVRRSAELASGSPFDLEFLNAKNWSRSKRLPAWRQQSNNSVITNNIHDLPSDFWDGYEGNGEPYGLINLDLARRMGRLTDGEGYRLDSKVTGCNPCGEIFLESHEACNLAELYLPNLNDIDEFRDAAQLMYMAVKTISMLPFVHPKTNEVVTRNRRLGIGVTGFCAAKHLSDGSYYDAVYENLEDFDRKYSRLIRSNESIKLTTVKPSGTNSLLPGVPPGVHPDYANFYIRRISFASNDPIVAVAEAKGYHIEPKCNIDGSLDYNTMIIDFPIKARKGTTIASDLTAIEQLENQLFLQTHWSDNSVSMTCYYKLEELPEIQEWLGEHYENEVKSASFLLHSGHGFKQAPYEEINELTYNEMVATIDPITSVTDFSIMGIVDSLECPGGSCPIK